jgi:hypothetical protein
MNWIYSVKEMGVFVCGVSLYSTISEGSCELDTIWH